MLVPVVGPVSTLFTLLQRREPSTAPWHFVESQPLGGCVVVSDQRLAEHADDGVVFRLWRAMPGTALHRVQVGHVAYGQRLQDDARVRHFNCRRPRRR